MPADAARDRTVRGRRRRGLGRRSSALRALGGLAAAAAAASHVRAIAPGRLSRMKSAITSTQRTPGITEIQNTVR